MAGGISPAVSVGCAAIGERSALPMALAAAVAAIVAPMNDPHAAFRGIHPILYALFGADGALDRDAMRRQVRACVAGGAQGLAVLGLATEVGKLSAAERRDVIAWAMEDLAGALPLAVTIFGHTPQEQAEAALSAERDGAAWLVLQPPPRPGLPEAELMAFQSAVIDRLHVPVGLQNAPDLMGLGLTAAGMSEMARRHANLRVLKAEGPATLIERVVADNPGLAVMNGRGGLELTDNFRAGCTGMIPAPDCFDVQVRAWAAMRAGDEAEAERLYRSILPAIAFKMQSVAHMIAYGKRIVAGRLGLRVWDRDPGLVATPFGAAISARFARELGPYAED